MSDFLNVESYLPVDYDSNGENEKKKEIEVTKVVHSQSSAQIVDVEPSGAFEGEDVLQISISEKVKDKKKWSATADDLLMKAVAIYGRDWIAVSKHVEHGFSREQCRHRWCRLSGYMYGRSIPISVTDEDGVTGVIYKYDPLKSRKRRKVDRNKTDTDATSSPISDVNQINDNNNSSCSYENSNSDSIEDNNTLNSPVFLNAWWGNATQSDEQQPQPLESGDSFIDPQYLPQNVEDIQMKLRTGPFSQEEDDAIVRAVSKFAITGHKGVWAALQRELGRSANNCNHRWKRHLSKIHPDIQYVPRL
mmetsp:Transcript_11369/g.17099  ORF Transcript_11369/g.17099 Transcript_11369/m.17099 type:complete len:305 (+) Transcript_11369:111-1025(+)